MKIKDRSDTKEGVPLSESLLLREQLGLLLSSCAYSGIFSRDCESFAALVSSLKTRNSRPSFCPFEKVICLLNLLFGDALSYPDSSDLLGLYLFASLII